MAFFVASLLAITSPVLHSASACPKTFTYHMDTRAAGAVYAGTHRVRRSNVQMLSRIARCQRVTTDIPRSKKFNASQRALWKSRRHEKLLDQNMSPAIASYYTDEGIGACGYGDVQGGLQFASLILRCGTMIKICHNSLCAFAKMVDHGPYVSGRTFDLNANLRAALACGGICAVRWRLK